MENINIYEDEEIRVEIDSLFHTSVLFEKNPKYRTKNLTQEERDKLADNVVKFILEKNLDLKGFELLCSGTIPLLTFGNFYEVSEPFEIFNFGMELIATISDVVEQIDEVIESIENFYNDTWKDTEVKVYCCYNEDILPTIKGFFVGYYPKEKLIKIMYYDYI